MCIECGQEVDDQPGRCPHCGKLLLNKAVIGWAFILLLILAFFLIIGVVTVK
jgi:hypothetical protein